MPDIISGHPPIDRYLAEDYARVRGMSSRFSAAICGYALRRQTALGVAGDAVEIGAFEGRFFIALALGLEPGERALGIDTFAWPDTGVLDRFHRNCGAAGLSRERYDAWKADSRALTATDLRSRLGGRGARFIHIDGDHSHASLRHDLEVAHGVLHERGLICVDDMLHPGYPTLITAVLDYLEDHPEMCVACIIDREDIVAATKFLLCRTEFAALYDQDLMTRFAPFHFVLGADVRGRFTLVLTPSPRLAEV